MSNKVEELRSIYESVTDGDVVVTEEQQELRGSYAEAEERLEDTIEEMRAELGFTTRFSTAELATLVIEFFKGTSDREIAEQIGGGQLDKSVTRARLRLHLFRDADFEQAPVDLNVIAQKRSEGKSMRTIASEIGPSKSTVGKYARLIEMREQAEKSDYTARLSELVKYDLVDESDIRRHLADGLDEAVDAKRATPTS